MRLRAAVLVSAGNAQAHQHRQQLFVGRIAGGLPRPVLMWQALQRSATKVGPSPQSPLSELTEAHLPVEHAAADHEGLALLERQHGGRFGEGLAVEALDRETTGRESGVIDAVLADGKAARRQQKRRQQEIWT
jgi:hypothetical protein